jgi:hypothetical protein
LYTLHLALLEYRDLHGTYPTDPDKWMDALRTLPDPNGSIAEALRFVDPNGYQATAQVASASTKSKPWLPVVWHCARLPVELIPNLRAFHSRVMSCVCRASIACWLLDDDFVLATA